jgi:hypothetical protein
MSYFHVIIQKKSNDWICIFKDLSESDLKKYLIKPYKLGKDLFYDGHILSVTEISKVEIVLTEKLHVNELTIVQDKSYRQVQKMNKSNSDVARMSAGHGYHDYEIKDCGKEVTKQYLSQSPGSGTFGSKILGVIKHPWVVRIVGGLLFLMAAAYFGFSK